MMIEQIPQTEYERLIHSLELRFCQELTYSSLSDISNILDIKESLVSDCVRRGNVVTASVLEAARKKGINPDFIKRGCLPVHLEPVDG